MSERGKSLFDRLLRLESEARNPRTLDLDRVDTLTRLTRLNDEDRLVADAVRGTLPDVARCVDAVTERLRRGGRLVYVGAGTSGRLGVLDAAECPPTFGTDPTRVVGVIAGGERALTRAVEGAEDRAEEGVGAMRELGVGPGDAVIGLAASWRTPYTVAAVTHARERGAFTAYITTNPPEHVDIEVDVLMTPLVGPEGLMGSTRLKAATAQKLILNMITTAAMVDLGKVYENMMVDLMATSAKLEERSKRVVMQATGASYEDAAAQLAAAGGSVKTAIVMTVAACSKDAAEARLASHGGRVRLAIEDPSKGGAS